MPLAPEALNALAATAVRVQLARRTAPTTQQWQPHPHQVPPAGDWRIWLLLGGRGAGKTRAGAEWIAAQVAAGAARRVALVGPTSADVRDVMVEGESGILACAARAFRPEYEPSKRRLTWPNGAIATTYSADEPDRLRGPQHDLAWCDEIGAWRFPETWDMLLFGLRLGPDPRVLATTTPRPVRLLLELMTTGRPDVAVRRGTTYENAANLAPAFMEQIVRRYEGTRLGRQELLAELLTDVEGALWTRAMVEASKVRGAPPLARIVVGVDPAVTSGEDSDLTGIVVAGKGEDGRGYVLWSGGVRMSPDGWARKVVALYHDYGADAVVAEANQGGELVRSVLRTVDPYLPIRLVHATRGKRTRAEPVAALWEQGKVSLVV